MRDFLDLAAARASGELKGTVSSRKVTSDPLGWVWSFEKVLRENFGWGLGRSLGMGERIGFVLLSVCQSGEIYFFNLNIDRIQN